MSGVYIPGMEMADCCVDCPFDYDHETCCAPGGPDGVEYHQYDNWDPSRERHPKCSLVPVPPHGRLIDADAFLDDLLFPSKQFEQGMRELVADAPTIIPAEEGDVDG